MYQAASNTQRVGDHVVSLLPKSADSSTTWGLDIGMGAVSLLSFADIEERLLSEQSLLP